MNNYVAEGEGQRDLVPLIRQRLACYFPTCADERRTALQLRSSRTRLVHQGGIASPLLGSHFDNAAAFSFFGFTFIGQVVMA
ncbi:MAG: hypothetical protein R3E95_10990 [Thiolinea sp.]